MSDPNLEWKTDEYWKTVTTAVSLTFSITATIAYVLRAYASRLTNARFRPEDYLMGIGLLLSYGATVPTIMNGYTGVGVSGADLPPDESRRLSFGSWLIQKFWPTSMAFIKISIIIFLQRIFGAKPLLRRCLDGLIVFITLWALAALLTNTFQCWPVSYYYNKNQSGHCMKGQIPFFMSMGATALAEDVIILLVPLPTVWMLQAKRRQKIAVTMILSLGSLVCICSLLRIIEFQNFILTDLSSSSALESIFTVLEINVAIICGCLPQMKPLFRRVLSDSTAGRSYENAGSSAPVNFPSSGRSAGGRSNQFQKLPEMRPHYDNSGVVAVTTGPARSSSEIELKGIEVYTSIKQEIRSAPIQD